MTEKMPRVIVTGACGLIGTEVFKYLKEQGNEVVPCDIRLGHNLGDETFVKAWFSKNKADYLVNLFAWNDHVNSQRKAEDLYNISLQSFRDFLDTNVVSLFSVCRAFAANNPKSGIVNFSGTYGLISPPPDIYPEGSMKHVGYCTSKAGVAYLTKYLAVHLAPDIRVNCIAPSGVLNKQDPEFMKKHNSKMPLKRMMNVKELNGLVEFLCSDKSSYMTGAVLNIDGGWTAW